jgi:uncharacterized membrane protein HdeD (DUF308 family)
MTYKVETVRRRSPPWLRMLQIIFGSIAILLSIVVLSFLVIFPAKTLLTIILFLSIVFLIVGIERIAIGVSSLSSTRKTRVTNIALGVVVIGLSIFLMEFPILTTGFLIIVGGVALLISGIARIVQGISRDISKFSKAFIIGTGVLSVVVSILVIANPIRFGLVLLAVMLAITLLIMGIEMISLGARGSRKGEDSIISASRFS